MDLSPVYGTYLHQINEISGVHANVAEEGDMKIGNKACGYVRVKVCHHYSLMGVVVR